MAQSMSTVDKKILVDAYVALRNLYEVRGNCPISIPKNCAHPVVVMQYFGLNSETYFLATKLGGHFHESLPPTFGAFCKVPDILQSTIKALEEFEWEALEEFECPEWDASIEKPKLTKAQRGTLSKVVPFGKNEVRKESPEFFSPAPSHEQLSKTPLGGNEGDEVLQRSLAFSVENGGTPLRGDKSNPNIERDSNAEDRTGDGQDQTEAIPPGNLGSKEMDRPDPNEQEQPSEIAVLSARMDVMSRTQQRLLDLLESNSYPSPTELSKPSARRGTHSRKSRLRRNGGNPPEESSGSDSDGASESCGPHGHDADRSQVSRRRRVLPRGGTDSLDRTGATLAEQQSHNPERETDKRSLPKTPSRVGNRLPCEGEGRPIQQGSEQIRNPLLNLSAIEPRGPPLPARGHRSFEETGGRDVQVRVPENLRRDQPNPNFGLLRGEVIGGRYQTSNSQDSRLNNQRVVPPNVSETGSRYQTANSQEARRPENNSGFVETRLHNQRGVHSGSGELDGGRSQAPSNHEARWPEQSSGFGQARLSDQRVDYSGSNVSSAGDGAIPLFAGLSDRNSIPMPIFKGEPENWKAYKASMELYLSNKGAFSKAAQLCILQNSLKGKISEELMTQIENEGEEHFSVFQYWKNLNARFRKKPQDQFLTQPEGYIQRNPWDGLEHSFVAKLSEIEMRYRRQSPSILTETVQQLSATLMRKYIPQKLLEILDSRRRQGEIDPFTDSIRLRRVVQEIFDDYERWDQEVPWKDSWDKEKLLKGRPRDKSLDNSASANSSTDKSNKSSGSNLPPRGGSPHPRGNFSRTPWFSHDNSRFRGQSNNDRNFQQSSFSRGRSPERSNRDSKTGTSPEREKPREQPSVAFKDPVSSTPGSSSNNRSSSRSVSGSSAQPRSKSQSPTRRDNSSDRNRGTFGPCKYCGKTNHTPDRCYFQFPHLASKSGAEAKMTAQNSDFKEPPSYPGETSSSDNEGREAKLREDSANRIPVNMDETPKRSIRISGFPVRALLDTGSSVSAINSDVAKKLIGFHRKGRYNNFDNSSERRSNKAPCSDEDTIQLTSDRNPVSLVVGNGGRWVLSERLINAEVTLGSKTIPLNFWVYPERDNQYQAIIGIAGLRTLGYDFVDPDGFSEWDMESIERAIRARPPNTPTDEIFRFLAPKEVVHRALEFPNSGPGSSAVATKETLDQVMQDLPEVGTTVRLPMTVSIPPMKARMVQFPFPVVQTEVLYFEPNLKELRDTLGELFISPTILRKGDDTFILEIRNVTGDKLRIPKDSLLGWICIGTEEQGCPNDHGEVNRLEIIDPDERIAKLTELIDWKGTMLEGQPRRQKIFQKEIIEPFHSAFALTENEIGVVTNGTVFDVDTGENPPIQSRARRTTPEMQRELDEDVARQKGMGIITESHGEWSSPVVPVRKKNGKLRLCVDYKRLNAITKRDMYGMQHVNEILSRVGYNPVKFFTTIDMVCGYWQIPCTPQAREKLAFVYEGGFYAYNSMPFGVKNAPAVFQRMMDKLVMGIGSKKVETYIDDILVKSQSFEEHIETLKELMRRISAAGLMIGPTKCCFFRNSVTYLGFLVTSEGLLPSDRNVKSISELPVPDSLKGVRRFLGMTGYYRRYVPQYSTKAKPLYLILKGTPPKFFWGDAQQQAFEVLRKDILESDLLVHADPNKEFILSTDASDVGVGACLQQKDDQGVLRVIGWASRTLNSAESNYITTEKECLAVLYGLDYFKYSILGKDIKVITDHRPLLSFATCREIKDGRLARWKFQIDQYANACGGNLSFVYKPGRLHTVPDALSRSPVLTPEETVEIEKWRDDGHCLQLRPDDREVFETIVDSEDDDLENECNTQLQYYDPQTDSFSMLWAGFHTDDVGSSDDNLAPSSAEQQQNLVLNSEVAKGQQSRDSLHSLSVGEPKQMIQGFVEIPEETKKRLLECQTHDPEAFAMKTFLRDGTLPSGNVLREWVETNSKDFVLDENECIWRKSAGSPGRTEVQLWVPIEARNNLLSELHDSVGSGSHQSAERTLKNLRSRFYWPGMRKQVEKYVKGCIVCASAKGQGSISKPRLRPIPPPGEPWWRVSADLLKFDITERGSIQLLVVVDFLTKFTAVAPITSKETSAVQEAFMTIFDKLGYPHELLTDQGPEFTSALMTGFCEAVGIKTIRTTTYYPAGNANTERMNRTIIAILTTAIEKDSDRWDQVIHYAIHKYNCSIHSSHGFKPYVLMFGREPNLPSSDPIALAKYREDDEGIEGIHRFIHRSNLWAQHNIMVKQDKVKEQHDKKSKQIEFKVGDHVMIKHQPEKNKKTAKDKIGPYIIKRCDMSKNLVQVVRITEKNQDDPETWVSVHPSKLYLASPELVESGNAYYGKRRNSVFAKSRSRSRSRSSARTASSSPDRTVSEEGDASVQPSVSPEPSSGQSHRYPTRRKMKVECNFISGFSRTHHCFQCQSFEHPAKHCLMRKIKRLYRREDKVRMKHLKQARFMDSTQSRISHNSVTHASDHDHSRTNQVKVESPTDPRARVETKPVAECKLIGTMSQVDKAVRARPPKPVVGRDCRKPHPIGQASPSHRKSRGKMKV